MRKLKILERFLNIYQKLLFVILYISMIMIFFHAYLDEVFIVLSIVIGLIPIFHTIAIRVKQKYIYQSDEKIQLNEWIKIDFRKNSKLLFISFLILTITLIGFSIYTYVIINNHLNQDNIYYVNEGLRLYVIEYLMLYSIYLCRKSQLIIRYAIENKVSEDGELISPRENTMVWNRFPSDVVVEKIPDIVSTTYVLWGHIILVPIGLALIITPSINRELFITAPWFSEYIEAVLINTSIFYVIYFLFGMFLMEAYQDYKKDEKYNKYSESVIQLFVNSFLPFILFYHVALAILKLSVGYLTLISTGYSVYVNEWILHLLMILGSVLTCIMFAYGQIREHNFVTAWSKYLEKEASKTRIENEGEKET